MALNFETGSSLADFQDAMFAKVSSNQSLSSAEKARLQDNMWVKTAQATAPGNLVVRHLCLIDFANNNSANSGNIMSQIFKLTYWKDGASALLWAEGYSYWLYCKSFFVLYKQKFNMDFRNSAALVDFGFQKTAYLRNAVMYPAPFGDLRDQPLEQGLQNQSKMDVNINLVPVTKIGTYYTIKSMPLGLNAHIPAVDSTVKIVNGQPTPFTWYTGYDKKYPDKTAELKDVFNIKRIFSIFK
jgi:hypothetical protein